MSSSITHVSRVQALYKAILKLHRGLPLEMRSLGDSYVKGEFHAHKIVPPDEAKIFMHEWTNYYVTLAKQLGQRKKKQEIGFNLSPEMLDNFREEQLGQLHELLKAAVRTEDDSMDGKPKIESDKGR